MPPLAKIFVSLFFYTLTPSGGVCAVPIIIRVVNSPGVDSVNGPDTVCLGRVYSYSAPADSLGNIYNWQAIGGYVVPASGTNTVTVTCERGVGD